MAASLFYNCILTQIVLQYPHKCMSSSTNSTNLTQKTLDFQQKYKTERCRYWYERGFCPYNQFCAFAHTEEELRGKNYFNEHYKTKICVNFKTNGSCKYGDRCQFLHPCEAPAAFHRSSPQTLSQAETMSEKLSVRSCDCEDKKHQKELDILTDYGLEVLSMYCLPNLSKKARRSDRWRYFLIDGVDQEEVQSFKWNEFEGQFADYDFKRKPRLGSM